MSKRFSELTDAGSLTGTEDVALSRESATAYTATTISFAAADNSINDASGQFVAEGFAQGQSVRVSGASNGVNNIYTGRISTITTAKIVIAAPEGDAIINESAGASVTITLLESVRTTVADIAGAASTDASAVTYTPADTGDWDSSIDPGNVDGALDQLALRVVTLEGTSGSGTVTSVALSAPSEFSVSGSPVTTSGTLTFTKANQNANLVYAGPTTGGAAEPTFRALVAADLPSGTTLWDAHAFYPGAPTSSAIIVRIPTARDVNFAANFSGSYAVASVAATASTVFTVTKNGSSIGTITFAISATTGTFTTSGGSAQTLAAGDVLAIVAPSTPDATLANVGFALAGTR